MKLNSFDSYKQYVAIQTRTNKAKIKLVWVDEQEMERVLGYIKTKIKFPKHGLCHGVRNGWEVYYLRNGLPGSNVIGTDISDYASQFSHVIQWDFHKTKPDWINKNDFIYSNSLDHSYNPALALTKWLSCLNENGLCFIHWAPAHGEDHMDQADCFGASQREYRTFLNSVGNLVDEIVVKTKKRTSIIFIVKKDSKVEKGRKNQHLIGEADWTDEKFTWIDRIIYQDYRLLLRRWIYRLFR